MLYTVDEVAKELNITKQAIYRHIRKPEFSEFIVVKDRVKHIKEEGVNRLKGQDYKDIVIQKQRCEITELKEEKKQLLKLLEQQNEIIKKSQLLEQKAIENTNMALSNVEKVLLEKKMELEKRKEEYNKNKKTSRWFNRIFKFSMA
ncbi:TPA: DNA-binding protein [Clostridium perfringens]|uniref:DNA-binding protein n=1 Tax=Clostridium perfringens TaxID=1502 RepID=UPI000B3887C8|nr:DNA-binding protein [Clostridium perfringens]OUN51908.1 DNA-binding protein [Clostridium perfringens]OUP46211.1 DNA-binding protein [Clostridium perfringens]